MSKKKQRVTPGSSKFLQLPADTIICILDFCTDSDLHCSIPFLCKQIRTILKKPLLKPERIEEEVQRLEKQQAQDSAEVQANAKNDDDYDEIYAFAYTENVKRVSLKKFISEFTAVEENLLWKRRCIKILPSLSTIKHDHLICYRKLYLQHYNIKKPLFYHLHDVKELQRDLSNLHTLVLSPMAAVQSNEKHYYKTLEFFKDKTSELVKKIEQMQAVQQQIGSFQPGKKASPSPLFREYEDVMTFLRETATVTSKQPTKSSPRVKLSAEYEVRLLSPVNGRSVSIQHSFESYTEEDSDGEEEYTNNIDDVHAYFYDITGSLLFFKKLELNIGVQELWLFVLFLGLKTYLPAKADVVSKVQLLHRIYHEIIFCSTQKAILSHCPNFRRIFDDCAIRFPKIKSIYDKEAGKHDGRKVVSYKQYIADYREQVKIRKIKL